MTVPIDLGGSRISIAIDPEKLQTAIGRIGSPDEAEIGSILIDEYSQLPVDRSKDEVQVDNDDEETEYGDIIRALNRKSNFYHQ